jgi:hypothetical protein
LHRFLIKEEFLITQDGVTVQVQLTQAIANGLWLALAIALPEPMSMTLRIERFKDRIRLSGELRIAHLEQVKSETEGCESPVVLDLEEVDLVDLEGVRFLNCSPYIREWMLQERIRGMR